MASNQCPPAKAIHFFRIILHSTLRDRKLRIPKKFVTRYGGSLPNPVFLKPPDGTEWKVHWKKQDNEIWFQNGWKEFTEYYCLHFGHLMMFKYEERTSTFEVIILDMSTLEIDYPSHENGMQDEFVEILEREETAPRKENRPKPSLKSLQPLKKLKTSTNEEEGRTSDIQNLYVMEKVKSEKELQGGAKPNPTKQEMEDMITTFAPQICANSSATRRKNRLSSAEKAQALERVSSFSPKNPFFKLPMQPSYVFRDFLCIPAEFSRKYLKKQQGTALLKIFNGKTWSVKYRVALVNNKLQTKLHNGWLSFSIDNNLEVSDVCVFELIKSNEIAFNVVIFRAAENPSLLLSQAEGGRVNVKDCEGILDIKTGTVSASNGMKTTKSQKLPRAQEEIKNLIPAHPFFRVNVSSCLLQNSSPNVPVAFLKKFMVSREKNMMIQLGKRSWPAKLLYYPHFSKGNLSVGWRPFAEESKLQAGDVCVFELIDSESAVLKVHIFRSHT